jgi:hypothetical protein
MANSSREILSKRAKTAALTRSRSINDPDLLQAKTDLEEAKLNKNLDLYNEAISRIVAVAPPLSPETQATLRTLLSQGVKL